MSDWGSGGLTVIDGDVLVAVGEVGGEPGEGGAGDTNEVLEAGEEDGVVYSVKGSGEVEEDEDGEGAGVGREKYVIGNLEEGGFRAVSSAEAGLEGFVKVICVKVGFNL